MTSIDSAAGSKSEGEEVSHFLPSEASALVELLKDFVFCPRESFAGARVACGNKNKEQRRGGEKSFRRGQDLLHAGLSLCLETERAEMNLIL